MTAFRDSQVIVLDTDRSLIKAGHGLHELLKEPSIELQARVGLRRSATEANGNGVYANGSTSTSNGVHTNGKAAHRVSDYLVGDVLDEALNNGEDVEVFWPFQNGGVDDWTQAEALWRYVLFHKLSIRRTQNESPVLLSFPASSSRRLHERITKLFFERLNVAAFSLIQRPLTQLYAANAVSGIVVDITRTITDITPIYDGIIQHNSRVALAVGYSDCETHLANCLMSNQGVVRTLSPPEAPLADADLWKQFRKLAEYIWKEGLVKVPLEGEQPPMEDEGITDVAAILVAGKEKAVIEAGLKKKASARANAAERERAREIEALDLIQVQWGEHNLTLGKERHRFCEPLFDAGLRARLQGVKASNTISLQEAVHLSVRGLDVDYRQRVYEGLFVTGAIATEVKGIALALQSHLSPYILNNPDSTSEVQPKVIRVLKVPEYFANFRERGEMMASFLGTSIVAKGLFSDPGAQQFVSKADYTKIGPRAIIDLVPTVL